MQDSAYFLHPDPDPAFFPQKWIRIESFQNVDLNSITWMTWRIGLKEEKYLAEWIIWNNGWIVLGDFSKPSISPNMFCYIHPFLKSSWRKMSAAFNSIPQPAATTIAILSVRFFSCML